MVVTGKRCRWKRFGVAVGTSLLLSGLAWLGVGLVPLPNELFQPLPSSLEFTDRNGLSLRTLANPAGQVARFDTEAGLPSMVEKATLAAEDARFWEHPGVDPLASLRALSQMVRNRRIVSGASTITQQLIKLAHPRPRTWTTKLIEALRALRLERKWDKERILHEYLSRLDYGNRCTGLREAARHYLGKEPENLDLAESAFLSGLPQAPSRLNPRLHFNRAKVRQEWVLGRMERLGWISAAERTRSYLEPIHLVPGVRDFLAPHFVDWIAQEPELGQHRGPVATTLDLRLQKSCEQILRDHLAPLRERQVGNGAVVVIDNRSDELLVMVGGTDWLNPMQGQVNATLARRSPGSALKPFTYLLALEAGATAADVIPDIPTEFPTPTGLFRPLNYDHHCRGPMRLRLALANSLNIPAVRALSKWSSPRALRRRLTACGITTLDRQDDDYGLGLTLGNVEVRLLELANAYAALARLGEWHPLNAIRGETAKETDRRVADPDACWLIADILSDADARSLAFGYDSPLRFDFPVACKTGTSSDFRDNWAIGFTPEFTVGVWVGNLDGHPMSGVSGVTGAGPVWHDIMTLLHEQRGTTWYSTPAGAQRRWIDPTTGHEVAEGPSAVQEWFIAGHLPCPALADDHDARGRTMLDAGYADWLNGPDAPRNDFFVVQTAPGDTSLRILNPLPGTIYLLDEDQPASRQRLRLKASRDCQWEAEGLHVVTAEAGAELELAVGRHRIIAEDTDGRRAETWIEIRRM